MWIAPSKRKCDLARKIARAWWKRDYCNPGCVFRVHGKLWGCGRNNAVRENDIECTKDLWHPMSGKPITTMILFTAVGYP